MSNWRLGGGFGSSVCWISWKTVSSLCGGLSGSIFGLFAFSFEFLIEFLLAEFKVRKISLLTSEMDSSSFERGRPQTSPHSGYFVFVICSDELVVPFSSVAVFVISKST